MTLNHEIRTPWRVQEVLGSAAVNFYRARKAHENDPQRQAVYFAIICEALLNIAYKVPESITYIEYLMREDWNFPAHDNFRSGVGLVYIHDDMLGEDKFLLNMANALGLRAIVLTHDNFRSWDSAELDLVLKLRRPHKYADLDPYVAESGFVVFRIPHFGDRSVEVHLPPEPDHEFLRKSLTPCTDLPATIIQEASLDEVLGRPGIEELILAWLSCPPTTTMG